MANTEGTGTASDATIDTTPKNVTDDPKAEHDRIIAALEAKVEKQKGHLARAQEALAAFKKES